MAKKKTDTQLSKEKTKKARQANAEKQKRYRESMKAQGYRARLVWEKPLGSGQTRKAAPVIREASLSIVRSNRLSGRYWKISARHLKWIARRNGYRKRYGIQSIVIFKFS